MEDRLSDELINLKFHFPGTGSRYGGSGNDVFSVHPGLPGTTDTISGGDGMDCMFGDYRSAGAGLRLTYDSLTGNGQIEVGVSSDTLNYSSYIFTSIEAFAGIPNLVAGNFFGSQYADWIEGSETDEGGGFSRDDFGICAGAGDDTIFGNGGDDHLRGEDGADRVFGGSGNDVLGGDAGEDFLEGGEGNDVFRDGLGSDTIHGGEGVDFLFFDYSGATAGIRMTYDSLTGDGRIEAGEEVDVFTSIEGFADFGGGYFKARNGGFTGSSYGDLIVGSEHDESHFSGIAGGDGSDTIYGHGGDDDISGGGDDDYLDGGTANDFLAGSTGNDTQVGGDGNDSLDGGEGNDSLVGGLGHDSFNGGLGLDTLVGGAGDDTYYRYYGGESGDILVEVAEEGTDLVLSSTTHTLEANIENLTLSATSNINGTGNDLGNVLVGAQGDNVLDGVAGNDCLDGGAGSDTLVGGTGNDTFGVESSGDVVAEAASQGTDLVRSSVAYTLGTNVENLELLGSIGLKGSGNSLANVISGTSGNDTLNGLAGADNLIGGAGNDSLHGSSGVDSLVGGQGNDTYGVESVADVVVEAASQGTDLVRSSVAYTLGTNVENLELLGSIGLKGSGNSLANVIAGGTGNDTLNGLAGADNLIGGAGNDSLHGSSGVDSLVGGQGNDTYGVENVADVVVEAASQGMDLVRSSVAYTLGTNVENLELLGSIGLKGSGNSLANVIAGGTGNDTLNGLAGADNLIGGAGNDSLLGSSGSDTLIGVNAATFGVGEIDTLTGGTSSELFVLGNAGGKFYNDGSSSTKGTEDFALITDFTVGSDKLQLDGAAENYYLGTSPVAGVSGSALFLENGTNDELVAIIRSGNSTALTAANTINTAVFV